MQLAEIQQRLRKLDTNKLIDIVKNFRQYGYDENIRNYALSLLSEQGITQNDLLLTGNLENKAFDFTNDLMISFRSNSKLAFLFYSFSLTLNVISIWFNPDTYLGDVALVVSFVLGALLYFFFLFKSFLDQSNFYKSIGDEFGSDGALLYLLLGMPFYIVMYFVFRDQMKEIMKVFPDGL